MKTGILVLLLLVLFSRPLYGEESSIVTIDIGSFSGFFGFGYEWLRGLSGHKLGLGIVDSQSLRVGYTYKKYFPDKEFPGEEKPSRIYLGVLLNATLEYIYTASYLHLRLGPQMGYDFYWGEGDQYYSNITGGFVIIYPPKSYEYFYDDYRYFDAFGPAFTVSFGYRY